MNPPVEIMASFRAGELQRRAERRSRLAGEFKSIVLRAQNEGFLLNEILTEDDLQIHQLATAQMRKSQLAFEKETRPGYWKRLWFALRGE